MTSPHEKIASAMPLPLAKPGKVRFWLSASALFLLIEIMLILFVDRPTALAVRDLTLAHPSVRDFFQAYTDIGLGKWYAWPSGIATLLGLAVLGKAPLSDFCRNRLKNVTTKIGFFFVATSAAGLASNLVKYLVGRARPKLLFNEGLYGFNPLHPAHNWNAFPSGHTATAFAVAAALALLFPKWRGVAYLFGILIGISRIMVSAHYPSDVLAGAVLALVVTKACAPLLQRTQ